jgi:hypothetical protein
MRKNKFIKFRIRKIKLKEDLLLNLSDFIIFFSLIRFTLKYKIFI